MAEYGVTDKGFVIKRLDTIMEEIHEDLTEAYGFDTRLTKPSFLDTLITTFSYQISDLWETAQNSYYAKYPSTATGVNLDNAIQYGGIRREGNKQTSYRLHCTGDDGTYVREGATVATNTNPEIRLQNSEEFEITREAFNRVDIKVASAEVGVYSISINGDLYSYSSSDGNEASIIANLASEITSTEYEVTTENNIITIEDKTLNRSNVLVLSDNLTTAGVTVIATFLTMDYGKITIPNGLITKMVNNITGFTAVTNLLDPIYGRTRETDIELRQSYLAKSALRSNTMIDSIVGELLNSVDNVESASGYENDSDEKNDRGMPPHSIEIVVEGGDDNEIAEVILRRKAGGIQTYGDVEVGVPGNYGDTIPIHFNRPDYLYVWLKIVLHGDVGSIPASYAALTAQSLIKDGEKYAAGDSLLIQLLNEGIYDTVSGLTYIEISTAYSKDKTYVPKDSEYVQKNIIVSSRQKILIDETRIEVTFSADS